MTPRLLPLIPAAVLALMTVVPAAAQEKEPSPAMKLAEVTEFSKAAGEGAWVVFKPFIEQMRKQGLPEKALADLELAAERFFSQTFEHPELIGEIAAMYDSIFTEEEIEDLIAFYRTDTGRKSLQTMPQVFAESARIGEKYAAKYQDAFQKEVAEILEEHPIEDDEDDEIPAE